MGTATIRFINDNPVYTRMYLLDRNGDESYQGTVNANSYKDMTTQINYLWIHKRHDNVPIRICRVKHKEAS
jgi:hypothetical protein